STGGGSGTGTSYVTGGNGDGSAGSGAFCLTIARKPNITVGGALPPVDPVEPMIIHIGDFHSVYKNESYFIGAYQLRRPLNKYCVVQHDQMLLDDPVHGNGLMQKISVINSYRPGVI